MLDCALFAVECAPFFIIFAQMCSSFHPTLPSKKLSGSTLLIMFEDEFIDFHIFNVPQLIHRGAALRNFENKEGGVRTEKELDICPNPLTMYKEG